MKEKKPIIKPLKSTELNILLNKSNIITYAIKTLVVGDQMVDLLTNVPNHSSS